MREWMVSGVQLPTARTMFVIGGSDVAWTFNWAYVACGWVVAGVNDRSKAEWEAL